jgi:MFS superfamily sulfate permease-like transporter
VSQTTKKSLVPEDGIKGLKSHFISDLSAGFLVFLIALPLSLGIAKASEFPPIMGLITAMIGGVLVSWFSGSVLTIKGPAAGLIMIVAGSVHDFGNGDAQLGWHLALVIGLDDFVSVSQSNHRLSTRTKVHKPKQKS